MQQAVKRGSARNVLPGRLDVAVSLICDGTKLSNNSPKDYVNETPYGEYDDDALIGQCRGGNLVAFGKLIEKYQDRLFNTVFRMVGNHDDALEITQEAFYKAMKGLRKFRGKAGFYTWLYRIAMNLCINQHRKNQKLQMTSLYAGSETADSQADGLLGRMADHQQPSAHDRLELRENHKRVMNALARIEPPARAVMVLRDIEELDYAQIARILQIPIGTVKSRLSRARMVIREQLKDIAVE